MARPKLGDGESVRLQMVITPAEIDSIDEWQHQNRVPSRSEAIRRLIQIGLEASYRAQNIEDALWSPADDVRQILVAVKDAADRAAAMPESFDVNGTSSEAAAFREANQATIDTIKGAFDRANALERELMWLLERAVSPAPPRNKLGQWAEITADRRRHERQAQQMLLDEIQADLEKAHKS